MAKKDPPISSVLVSRRPNVSSPGDVMMFHTIERFLHRLYKLMLIATPIPQEI